MSCFPPTELLKTTTEKGVEEHSGAFAMRARRLREGGGTLEPKKFFFCISHSPVQVF